MAATNYTVPPPDKSRWVKGVDTLRFVLAFIVALSHMYNPFTSFKQSPHLLLRLLTVAGGSINGVAAVITFFIISGFVIHFPNRHHNSSINVVGFLIRRILRIGLPLVVVVTVAKYYGQFELIPIWSLYCELAYYVLYPILFALNISWKKIFIASFIIALGTIAIFDFDVLLSAVKHQNINYMGNYWELGTIGTIVIGLPCWLLGVLLAERIDALNYEVSFYQLSIYRLLVLVVSALLVLMRFHAFIGYILTFNFFALLLGKWLEKEIVYHKTHQQATFLEYLGKFSYTLYLWGNLLVLFFSGYITYNFFTANLMLLMAVCASYLLYLITEYPSHIIAQKLSKISGHFWVVKVYQNRYQK